MTRRATTPRRRVLLTLTGGPLSSVGLTVPGWPWSTPQDVLWATRDASDRCIVLGPDKDLLNLVAARASTGGLGWVPYRRAVTEPLTLGRATVWRYEWHREQDPAHLPQRSPTST